MTAAEYECQLNTAIACVEAFKGVLDALSEVDDVVGRPGEPCPVASQAAVKRIRRIVQDVVSYEQRLRVELSGDPVRANVEQRIYRANPLYIIATKSIVGELAPAAQLAA